MLAIGFAAAAVSISLDKNIELGTEAELRNACAVLINDAIEKACAETPGLADIIDVEKDSDGTVSVVNVKSSVLNEFSLNAVAGLQEAINELENVQIYIPAGNIFLSRIFAGRGPMLRVSAYPLSSCELKYSSSFTEKGINQSLFSLYANVEMKAAARMGIYTHSFDVSRTVPVCEIIIVGRVPQTYANITDSGDFLNLVP